MKTRIYAAPAVKGLRFDTYYVCLHDQERWTPSNHDVQVIGQSRSQTEIGRLAMTLTENE